MDDKLQIFASFDTDHKLAVLYQVCLSIMDALDELESKMDGVENTVDDIKRDMP